MINSSPKISVSDTSNGFEYWINRPYISDARRIQLKQATLLILPYDSLDNARSPLFSSATRGLLDQLTGKHSDLVPAVAIDEDNYAELVLHGKLLDLGKIIALTTVIPLSMNLISNYIQKNIDGDGRDIVRFELTIVGPDGTSSNVKYDGPATTFEKIFAGRVRKITEAFTSLTVTNFRPVQSVAAPTSDGLNGDQSNAPEPPLGQSPLKQEAIDDSKQVEISNRRKNGKKRNR